MCVSATSEPWYAASFVANPMVNLCAGIIKYLKTMLTQIHYKERFVSLDAIFRPWTKCFVERRHFLKDSFPDPVVRPERAIRGFVESLLFSIMMTRKAESHNPFWRRPFRLFVIRPCYFYLAPEDRNFGPFLRRGRDLLQPILSWRHIIVCKDHDVFELTFS